MATVRWGNGNWRYFAAYRQVHFRTPHFNLTFIEKVYEDSVKMTSSTELSSAKPIPFGSQIVIQPPLTRLGSGPGLLLLRPSRFSDCQQKNETLDPEPIQKWAEEGFAVAQITVEGDGITSDTILDLSSQAKQHLADLPQCSSTGSIGLIGISTLG